MDDLDDFNRWFDHVNLQISSLKVDTNPSVVFSYDNDGLLQLAGNLQLFRHPDNGKLVGTAIASITDAYEYNEFGDVMGYEALKLGDPNDPNSPASAIQFSFDCERDKLGRISLKTETVGEVTTVRAYRYDPAGRLWRVCGDVFCSDVLSEYLYDDNGNRIGGSAGGESVSGI